jgi:hypothetical protein
MAPPLLPREAGFRHLQIYRRHVVSILTRKATAEAYRAGHGNSSIPNEQTSCSLSGNNLQVGGLGLARNHRLNFRYAEPNPSERRRQLGHLHGNR